MHFYLFPCETTARHRRLNYRKENTMTILEIMRELRKLGRERRKLAVKAAQDRLIKSIVRRDANRN